MFLTYKNRLLLNNRAFTLLELSVVLIIISVILSTAISIGSTRIEAQRLKDTKNRIFLIDSAIKQYVLNYNRLPCPAVGSIAAPTPAAPAPVGFGIEARKTTGDKECDVAQLTDNSLNIVSGVVPHKDLGISPAAILDGWENNFTYVVDNRYTFEGSEVGLNGFLGEAVAPEININNSAGTNISANGVYLLISHGNNGYGAWPARGIARNPLPANFDTDYPLENNNQENGTDFDINFIQTSHIERYDDIIFYRNKWQIDVD